MSYHRATVRLGDDCRTGGYPAGWGPATKGLKDVGMEEVRQREDAGGWGSGILNMYQSVVSSMVMSQKLVSCMLWSCRSIGFLSAPSMQYRYGDKRPLLPLIILFASRIPAALLQVLLSFGLLASLTTDQLAGNPS